jgi:hypothetical protein
MYGRDANVRDQRESSLIQLLLAALVSDEPPDLSGIVAFGVHLLLNCKDIVAGMRFAPFSFEAQRSGISEALLLSFFQITKIARDYPSIDACFSFRGYLQRIAQSAMAATD